MEGCDLTAALTFGPFSPWTRSIRLRLLRPLFPAPLKQKRRALGGDLGGLFCVFNYVPLTDTLLYINWVKLGNHAAALAQTVAPLPRY